MEDVRKIRTDSHSIAENNIAGPFGVLWVSTLAPYLDFPIVTPPDDPSFASW